MILSYFNCIFIRSKKKLQFTIQSNFPSRIQLLKGQTYHLFAALSSRSCPVHVEHSIRQTIGASHIQMFPRKCNDMLLWSWTVRHTNAKTALKWYQFKVIYQNINISTHTRTHKTHKNTHCYEGLLNMHHIIKYLNKYV